MSVFYLPEEKLFHLKTLNFSYVFQVSDAGYLKHWYAGPKLDSLEGLNALQYAQRRAFGTVNAANEPNEIEAPDVMLHEYGTFNVGDFRTPSFIIRDSGGFRATDPRYVSHRVLTQKTAITGLPSSFGDNAETLEILLEDPKTKVQFILFYSLFADSDVMARSVKIINKGVATIRIEKAASFTMDLAPIESDLITFNGAWARERQFERARIRSGMQSIASGRGLSSHQNNPAFMIADRNATETQGNVFAFAFVYSGNFLAEIEKEQWGEIRVQFGLNPEYFEWTLAQGEEFHTPEVLMSFSGEGFAKLSHSFHDFFRSHLIRSPWCMKSRPVLINNWEATYFDFNEEKLLKIAEKASELGVELLVLDDGWFGHRNNACSSLGDWTVFQSKLPCGIGELSRKINALGMKFGLWFEPEMISPDSNLYKEHPDWCLHIPGRKRSLGRNQLVLDMSRADVRNEIFRQMTNLLDNANIEYIKWDANRHLTEVGSALFSGERQGEISHRYVLGFYELTERIIQRYPNLLIEGCSGGGGRFDAGMLYYVPQIWTSDDTDAVERLRIQYGTSFIYPCSSMGAHVSASPNHQVHRTTPLQTRGNVAMAGTFGFELDLNKLSEEEQKLVTGQIRLYHRVHHLIEQGDLYRLSSPFTDSITAWMNVAKDRSEFMVTAVQPVQTANTCPVVYIKLRGLDSRAVYENENEKGIRISGSILMNLGYGFRLSGDASSEMLYFKRV